MTGSQLRAARGLLGWSAKMLAEFSAVSWSTIQRYEACGRVAIPDSDCRYRLSQTLKENGIEFMDDKTHWIGVCLKSPR